MRIVSLVPSLTETLCDLGLEDDLVGVTRWCVRPRDVVEGVERVGGTKDPDVARIAELRPDLVVVDTDENRREDAEALAARGLRLFVARVHAVDDVAPTVRALGDATRRPAEAKRLARDVEEAVEGVRASAFGEPEVRLLVPVWRDPWLAPGPGTYLGSVVELAGARNATRTVDARWAPFDVDSPPGNPEGVLLPTEPYRFRTKDVRWFEGRGFPAGSVALVNGEEATWFGARTVTGVRAVERVVAAIRRSVRAPGGGAKAV